MMSHSMHPSYWVKDLNIKAEATKLLEEKFNKKI